MSALARLPLEDGGSILFQMSKASDGPVKATGRGSDTIHDLPHTLQSVLGPVTGLARAALAQLRQAGPGEVVIEFGVDMASEAGAVIAKAGAGCHLNVTVTWRGAPAADAG